MKIILKFLLPAFILSSCASLSTQFDSARAKSVHKVAIVAVEVQQARPTDNLGLSQFHTLKDGADGQTVEMQTMAKNVVLEFSSQLQKKTNWQVLPFEQMAKNSIYRSKVEQAMTGVRSVLIANNELEAVYLKGTLDSAAFRKMSLVERAQLAKALNVDALAELIVYNQIDQSAFSLGHLTGDADFAYIGNAHFQVYGPDSEEPIWRNKNVKGNKTKSSDELPGQMSKLEKQSKLGEEASNSATAKLIAEYPL